jgi:hypothetical protein
MNRIYAFAGAGLKPAPARRATAFVGAGLQPAPTLSMPTEEEPVKTIVALAVMSLAFAATANAQETQQSFKTILGKGYDIKNVTFAKGEATENREIFVITLQKEKSIAVCYFAALNWINLSAGTLEDSKRCDVRY